MAFSSRHALVLAASLFLLVSPAASHRTAIDRLPDPSDPNGDGTSVTKFLSGYCDLQGDECSDNDGMELGYQVSLDGGANYVNRVYVQGNGLLTFGAAVDFNESAGPNGESLNTLITDGQTPSLLLYGRSLVSAGQNNTTDYENSGGFLQSATLSMQDNAIKATWYTCKSPFECFENPYFLTLTPTSAGFRGVLDFSAGSGGSDRGYVVDGVFVPTGTTFLLPAQFLGLSPSGVPEPASWMTMIAGFGLIGGMARRRTSRASQANG